MKEANDADANEAKNEYPALAPTRVKVATVKITVRLSTNGIPKVIKVAINIAVSQ